MYFLIGVVLATIIFSYDYYICKRDIYIIKIEHVLIFCGITLFGPFILISIGMFILTSVFFVLIMKAIQILQTIEINIKR